MHSSSRTWISPRLRADNRRQGLNASRRKICRNSPFWSLDFDLEQHRRDWAAGKERECKHKLDAEQKVLSERITEHDTPFPDPPPSIRKPLDGKYENFSTCQSLVLYQDTVFCPQLERAKEHISPWPSQAEMKYEGDDRISTDRSHSRFPGFPRKAGNETVNWQLLEMIKSFSFDDFLRVPNEVDIFMRTHWIPELEFTDEEGEEALGKDMMRILDPKDQFLE